MLLCQIIINWLCLLDSDFGLDDDLVQVAIEEEKAALELELVLERTRKLKQKKLVKVGCGDKLIFRLSPRQCIIHKETIMMCF